MQREELVPVFIDDLFEDLASAAVRLQELVDAGAVDNGLIPEIAGLLTSAQESASELLLLNGGRYVQRPD